MLLSMTGYGAGQAESGGVSAFAEIRTVNNRYLKLHTRLPEGYAAVEPRVEELVRRHVRRGSVQLNVEVRKAMTPDDYQINRELVAGYFSQIKQLQETVGDASTIRLDTLLLLPGAVQDTQATKHSVEEHWSLVAAAIQAALDELTGMRQSEGAAMAKDLAAQTADIARCADDIEQRAPLVVAAYETRLHDRINKLMAQFDVESTPTDVIREIGVFAERADISEEIVRLRSHLDQFADIMNSTESGAGRKLEFLVQELLRETNTIGSKANDADIARHVVHAKTCIERLREMVQNIE